MYLQSTCRSIEVTCLCSYQVVFKLYICNIYAFFIMSGKYNDTMTAFQAITKLIKIICIYVQNIASDGSCSFVATFV